MSMFSFFRRSTNITQPEIQSPKEAAIPDADSDDGKESFDSVIEVSGGKGWPTNATVLLYHKKQGLIVIGTEGGSIYVYGDGFQYMRPWLTEQANEVVSIVALYPNRILVAFGDSSIVVMELPTLEVIDLLRASSWMNPKWGDITAIHCDMINEKNFIYIGTSEGYLTVLDVMESAIRICDFELTSSDFSLQGQGFSVSDLQSCPKDERYLAIGFEGAQSSTGAVAVYDLLKHKVLKVFATSGISTIHWHHSGEVLYAGTRTGEILAMHPERGTCNTVWNAKDEKIDDDDDDDNSSALYIRRISWLAPQQEGAEGCLFVLIATNSPDNDNLKNVVVGLHPSNIPGEMNIIFALPPISYEKIISFRVVPTYNKSLKETATTIEELEKTAGLLLLVQRQVNGHLDRHLYIMRCPTSEIKDWALEMGTLPDPRKAREVQPAAADITVTSGLVPNFKNPLSLGKALLNSAVDSSEQTVSTALTQKAPTATPVVDDVFAATEGTSEKNHNKNRMSRRISARQFYETQMSLNELEASLKDADTWEMVLVNGEHEENTEGVLRQQDVVFNGHADGTIIAYGVSMPDTRKEFGKASIWLPLTALRCGTTAVTALHADELTGLLLSGDEEGYIVLHEVFDKQTNIGAIDLVKKIYDQAFSEADEELASLQDTPPPTNTEAQSSSSSQKIKGYEDFTTQQFLKDAALYDYNYFNSIREVYRVKLPSQHVTSSLALGSLMILVVGTADGNIYINNDLKSTVYHKIDKIESIGAHGAVKGLDCSYYYHKNNFIVTIYAYFESGHIVVIDIQSMNIIAYTVAFGASKASMGGGDRTIHNVKTLPVLNAAFNVLNKPTLQSYAYIVTRMKHHLRGSSRLLSSASVDSTTSDSSSRPQSTLLQTQAATASATGVNTTPPPIGSTVQKRSFFGSMRVTKDAPTSPTGPAMATAAATSTSPVPSEKITEDYSKIKLIEYTEIQVPKYLVLISGNTVSTAALNKFLIPAPKTSLQNTAAALSGVQTKDLCEQTIISSQIYYLPDKKEVEDVEDGEAQKGNGSGSDIPRAGYLACVDNEGLLRLISLKTRKPVHHANLLEGVVSTESNEDDTEEQRPLFTGTLLPNGNSYLVGKGIMQYSATLSFVDEELSSIGNLLGFPLPERAIPTSKELDKTLALLHGREQMISNMKAMLKKRRSSVINLSAAPTDLYKIFQKTREQRSREELLGKDKNDDESMNNAQKTNVSAGKVKSELDQLKESFAERGERINRVAMKMDDFKQQAQDYRQTVKEQKEKLQKRNTRWGLF